MSDLPVVVVGAGPQGLAAAAHLLERGLTPLVLEAGPTPARAVLAATAVSDRWGVGRYARLNGMFNAPMMAASAIARFIDADYRRAAIPVLAIRGWCVRSSGCSAHWSDIVRRRML